MEEPKPPNRAHWRLVALLLVATPVILLIITVVWVQVVASRRWAEMEQGVARLVGEAEARESRVPVLYGKPIAGNAWEDYLQAYQCLKPILPRSSRYPADPDRAEKELAEASQALEHWRRAVHRDRCRFPGMWEYSSDDDQVRWYQAARALAQLGQMAARVHLREGRIVNAVECYLDVARLALDLGQNTNMRLQAVSHEAWQISLDGLCEVLRVGAPERPVLDLLDQALTSLDSSFPPSGPVYLNQATAFGQWLLRDAPHRVRVSVGETREAFQPGWRDAYSLRLAKANLFSGFEQGSRRLASLESGTWKELQVRVGEGQDVLHDLTYVPWVAPIDCKQVFRAPRVLQAKLRLIRIATRYKLGSELPDLQDPFGEQMSKARVGTRLRVWSRGPEGVDHGGLGDWRDVMGKDIVLEVER